MIMEAAYQKKDDYGSLILERIVTGRELYPQI